MKLHLGKLKNPGVLRFITTSYWFQENDEPRRLVQHNEPQATTWPIKGMWGVSMPWLGFFIGVIRLGKYSTANAGADAKLLPRDPNAPEKCSRPGCDGMILPGSHCPKCLMQSDNVLVNFPRR